MNRKSLPGSGALLATGIALGLFGLLMLFSPVAVGNAVVKLAALVLMLTGVVQLIQALRGVRGPQRLLAAILGIVVAGLGVLVWFNPELGSGFLTALLMIFFVVNGLWKLTLSMRYRPARGWAWLLLSGLVSLVFVYLLWKQWPLGGAWAIGVLVGLDLLLTGVSLVILSRAMRRLGGGDYVETINL
jgi:uncharacterized membrane protein HdeD (DUF308 family)